MCLCFYYDLCECLCVYYDLSVFVFQCGYEGVFIMIYVCLCFSVNTKVFLL